MLPIKKKKPGRGKRGAKAQALSVEQKVFNMFANNITVDRKMTIIIEP
jgi:hypothetical protein